MSRSGIVQFILFFVYVLLQVLLLRNLVLFNSAFCFLYIAFILLLPIEWNSLVLMVIGFFLGFTIDIFYDSMGLHAMATVVVCLVFVAFAAVVAFVVCCQSKKKKNRKVMMKSLIVHVNVKTFVQSMKVVA